MDKVQVGALIAIRNGRSEVVDEHIRLEVDKFGKISAEPVRNHIYKIFFNWQVFCDSLKFFDFCYNFYLFWLGGLHQSCLIEAEGTM